LVRASRPVAQSARRELPSLGRAPRDIVGELPFSNVMRTRRSHGSSRKPPPQGAVLPLRLRSHPCSRRPLRFYLRMSSLPLPTTLERSGLSLTPLLRQMAILSNAARRSTTRSVKPLTPALPSTVSPTEQPMLFAPHPTLFAPKSRPIVQSQAALSATGA